MGLMNHGGVARAPPHPRHLPKERDQNVRYLPGEPFRGTGPHSPGKGSLSKTILGIQLFSSSVLSPGHCSVSLNWSIVLSMKSSSPGFI